MPLLIDVAIVGAGPFGLSLASHLKTANANFRVFGKPMEAWDNHMPPGMFLKSGSSAMDLPDPNKEYPIENYFTERKQEYTPRMVVHVDDFITYGREFQSRLVPECVQENVKLIERDRDGFLVYLTNNEVIRARQVVMAIGVYDFRYLPSVLAGLPTEYCTHSSTYGPIDNLIGKKVGVVGGGASAVDLTVALKARDIDVTLLVRRKSLRFQDPPRLEDRNLYDRVRTLLRPYLKPDSGIGGGWILKAYQDAPFVFYALPAFVRRHILNNTLGPASTWKTKEIMEQGNVPVIAGKTPKYAKVENGKIKLLLRGRDGSAEECEFDHIIGATGYKVDIDKVSILTESLRRRIRTYDGAPVLNGDFETTCQGLYFVGPASAMSFGPVMRFVCGSIYTMKRLSKRLAPETYSVPKTLAGKFIKSTAAITASFF